MLPEALLESLVAPVHVEADASKGGMASMVGVAPRGMVSSTPGADVGPQQRRLAYGEGT